MAHAPIQPPGDSSRPIDRLLGPLQRFLRIEAAGGILLLLCAAAALIWANSPWRESYDHFWHTYLKVGVGDLSLKLSLAHFVNDGLMAIFFFVVGLEIKRELIVGELASLRKASVPIAAAIGGMVVPALVYVAFNPGGAEARGWAIPMATDIAFAVGIMAMLGRRVPLAVKVFLTAVAIVDDIGAVAVIAIFYTDEISFTALGVANVLLLASIVGNLLHVRTPLFYAAIGLGMWLMLLQSGVHATVGGVLLALTIPSRVRMDAGQFTGFVRAVIEEFGRAGKDRDDIMANAYRQRLVLGLEEACERVQTPLRRLEHELHPWVSFLVMPVFALANAGVTIGGDFVSQVGSGVGLGVILGLVLGKPVGIVLATWLAVRAGLGDLPRGGTWPRMIGVGCLAGIGFTMSLFIANLAFGTGGESPLLLVAKAGILCGSLISGVVGYVILLRFGDPPQAEERSG